MGEFDQKGAIATKYGRRKDYLKAIAAFQKNGIEVLVDVVLNHRLGADATEEAAVVEGACNDRNCDISEEQKISAWTKFDFPGRKDTYSSFHWNASHFSGTDWDDAAKRNGIFRFAGKDWNQDTDTENGNYDYLMGADLDTDNPEVVEEMIAWGRWYYDTIHMDGMRLDAVKHIGFDFYRKWLAEMQRHAEHPLFVVGEYWTEDHERLLHYLDATDRVMSLFDVPLHFNFFAAATSDGAFDMSRLYENTLTALAPEYAVSFVDNHDTQPGQALYSFVPGLFKPTAYACILLRRPGTPCVFYGDYYGIPHDNVPPVSELLLLLKIRERCAYGEEHLYFDEASVVGFTREGDEAHPDSGVAVLCTNACGGKKRMYVGAAFSGSKFVDVLGRIPDKVEIDAQGWGEFSVNESSLSVWLTESAAAHLYTDVPR